MFVFFPRSLTLPCVPLFFSELRLSAGAVCVHLEKTGVRRSVSKAQPGATQPPAPLASQGYAHKAARSVAAARQCVEALRAGF